MESQVTFLEYPLFTLVVVVVLTVTAQEPLVVLESVARVVEQMRERMELQIQAQVVVVPMVNQVVTEDRV
jgi:hypothetical protein